MRILGIDYGEKRIGVALSDPLGITAQGLTTIERTQIKEDLQKILNIIQEKEVEEVVVGLPKHMNNTLGDKAHAVLAFVELLKKRVQIPIHTIDERLSTVRANKAMLEGDLSRKKRKERIDMIAAQFILQNYLARTQK
ncbi:MAG: Holliday junction resolvase RuvX [Candidatus Jettenia sp.]|uniref:Putative pre-16S rRNA nuclease n=1 Tax=Candidatus Jettenia caeni TaxID=247490 RepID=I3ILA4_9BACT|nr:Holliday junction resolvase RuvX [Candidatus Jettenia sp. AMX1]MBC6927643.1 Holliday junction resolvase RuvX [Candidatus Jettenia sp.]WKZ14338.1 MAG: Holliday junction resolvase RuvX [Candidatus Jettenia caeni]WKZ18536.1 MAG: Holliday junction resolvase RuvX [Candidatus Jettenia sp. CY-1]KAA0250085.1 MAG: Holliday junction resolvase RuvX [Candidatus Jettenia sp. AMX1]MCE7880168.1 Holliday junction resolvase RuvX [Candidatus Jettenia sp. AMX1]